MLRHCLFIWSHVTYEFGQPPISLFSGADHYFTGTVYSFVVLQQRGL